MARGLDRPPRWAWVATGLALVAVAVVGVVVKHPAPAYAPKAGAAATSSSKTSRPSLASLRADGDLSIYYIGDSITDGWNASTQANGYRPQLTKMLQSGGPVTETSTYKAGATLGQVKAMAKLPASVDVAVIELGTNDVHAITDAAAFGQSYQQLATQLAAVSKRMACVGVLRTGSDAQRLNVQIRRACTQVGGAYVDISDLWHATGYFAPQGSSAYPGTADGGHPNDAGHAVIARRIYAALTS